MTEVGIKPTKFPFPPREGALTTFPVEPPFDVPISSMARWWLRPVCSCGIPAYPLRLMAAERGWQVTLRQVLPRMVCRSCRRRPYEVWLVDEPTGDLGRHGATEKRLRLL